MAAPRPEHAHATDRPATATLPPRPAHTTTGWRQDRRPVVSKRPLHNLAAAKMSPHIHIGPEPVLAAHARSPPAAGSRCPAGADSAPHSEQNFFRGGHSSKEQNFQHHKSSKIFSQLPSALKVLVEMRQRLGEDAKQSFNMTKVKIYIPGVTRERARELVLQHIDHDPSLESLRELYEQDLAKPELDIITVTGLKCVGVPIGTPEYVNAFVRS